MVHLDFIYLFKQTHRSFQEQSLREEKGFGQLSFLCLTEGGSSSRTLEALNCK